MNEWIALILVTSIAYLLYCVIDRVMDDRFERRLVARRRGVRDGGRGFSAGDNPYDPASYEGQEWLQGYYRAREKVDRAHERQGRNAARLGMNASSNPYRIGTDGHNKWRQGYLETYERMKG